MIPTDDYLRQANEQLLVVLARLDPILKPHGFLFHPEYNDVSSGGSFSNGYYKRPPIQIGLIVRGNKLGGPHYVYGEYHTGHNDLIEELGCNDESVLRFDDDLDKWELVTVDGRDTLDALVADMEKIILPTIVNDISVYQHADIAAHNNWIKRWSSK
jgi:hypothetical protein